MIQIKFGTLKRIIKEAGMGPVAGGIPHAVEQGLKVITLDTLRMIAPQAAEDTSISEDDLDIIWYMDRKPELQAPVDSADDFGREEWSETNEPELAEWLSEDWDNIAIDVNGQKIVILAGTYDDEYGWFWSNADQTWHNYMF